MQICFLKVETDCALKYGIWNIALNVIACIVKLTQIWHVRCMNYFYPGISKLWAQLLGRNK